MSPRRPLGIILAAAVLTPLTLPALALPAAAAAPEGAEVQLLGINDFHGRIADTGVEMASTIERLRSESTAPTVAISSGDNIGASTFPSSSQQDTPTLDVLNALDFDTATVGNHEFDRGYADLRDRVVPHAEFPHLGANVRTSSGDVVDGLESYELFERDGIRIAVIGVVTGETGTLVNPAGIQGISFTDPTAAVNETVEELGALPEDEQADLVVVSAHTGAADASSLEAGIASNSEFRNLVQNSDAEVDAFFTAHTHQEYTWEAPVPGASDRTRPVIQTGSYGKNVGQINLRHSGDGDWELVSQALVPTEDEDFSNERVSAVKAIVDDAVEKAKEIGSEVVGSITEDIPRASKTDGSEDRGAESTLGNLVADALKDGVGESQLEPADFAITNPGGLRSDLLMDDQYGDEAPGEVTVAELDAVLPFANDHGVVTLTGADVLATLEQQWQPEGARNAFLHLGVSKELEVIYDSYDEDAEDSEDGPRILSAAVNGEPIDPDAEYRVATLSFLAAGGDNFSALAHGEFQQSGLTDFEVWKAYFEANSPVSPDVDERQADAQLDVFYTGKATASLRMNSPAVLTITSDEDVSGPFTLAIEAPEGASLTASEGEIRGEGEDAVLVLDGLTAGTTEIDLTIEGAAPGETLRLRLQSDREADWWDDDPAPIPQTVEVTVPDGGGDGGGGSGDGGPGDGDSGDAGGSGGSGDGKPSAEDLPRTGTEVTNAMALGLILVLAGAITVLLVRRRV